MDIIKTFRSYLKNWKYQLQEDEWFFAELRKETISKLKESDAFKIIPDALELLLEQTDDSLSLECYILLLDIIRKSNTTQINPELKKNWEKLKDYSNNFNYNKHILLCFNKLIAWYKLDDQEPKL